MALTLPFLPASASHIHLSEFPVSQKAMPGHERRMPCLNASCTSPTNAQLLSAVPFSSRGDRMARAGDAKSFLKSAIGLISWFNATVGREKQSWISKKCQQANVLNGALSL